MINRLIEWSLRNRFLVFCGVALLMGFGVRAVYQTPVDAIPDLIFHFLRAAPRPVGEDDDLVFAQVRNHIHRRLINRAHTETDEQSDAAKNQEAVSQRPFDDAVDHKKLLVVRKLRLGVNQIGRAHV